ncbi:hypothetical protein [Lysinibacillus sp. BW-2-10]|uniref:hypothetical protein n=1 Tax=Lysinibacillus sp. BW-2-10 TaxID=2590030 RepID=UPI00117D55C6|nr:hypothetical protein [Lysinibacillus sp. BW-2-10]TSI03320.1 hypothetical protein FJQ64_17615 [Lysinibacillus sp. BW-2-10]
MEGIIIMIIALIFSALFKGNKNAKNQKPMPPFNSKPQQTFETQRELPKRRTLEDFASEIFEQLNEKANPTTSQPEVKKEVPKIAVERVEKPMAAPTARKSLDTNRTSDRNVINTARSVKKDPITSNEIGSYVPTTRDALVQAIITSEILGPPKAKQR